MSNLREIVTNVVVGYNIIIFAVGCVSNPLTIFVYSRPTLSTTSSSVYFRFLAFIDFCSLASNLAVYITNSGDHLFSPTTDIVSCYLLNYVIFAFMYTSSWILVGVSLERALSVVKPLQAREWFNTYRAKLASLVIFVVGCIMGLPIVFTIQRSEFFVPEFNTTITIDCWFNETWLEISMVFDICVYSLFPAVILISCTVIIMNGLAKSRQQIKTFETMTRAPRIPQAIESAVDNDRTRPISSDSSRMTEERRGTQMAMTSQDVSSNPSVPSNIQDQPGNTRGQPSNTEGESSKIQGEPSKRIGKPIKNRGPGLRSSHARAAPVRPKMPPHERSLMRTLILLNTSFIICTLPVSLYQILPFFTAEAYTAEVSEAIYRIFMAMAFTNNALNFFLYCIAGSKFRAEAKNVLKSMFTFVCRCRG